MNLTVQEINIDLISEICAITQELNPEIETSVLKQRQAEMFTHQHYHCFGLFENEQLIGVSSAWLTTRLYCGKQLELDNVAVKSNLQSKGCGTFFLNGIENWAKQNHCETIELNAYVHNHRSHKFYFDKGYKILGFHFQKKLS